MADIEKEREWMRRRSIEAKREDAEAAQRRYAEYEAEAAKWCHYCFHERHEIEWASLSMSGDLTVSRMESLGSTVLYCKTEGCICGVHPCAQCGSRRRVPPDEVAEFAAEQCADCGHGWLGAVYA